MSKIEKKLQLIQTIWDVMLYSQHFTFHWKLLGLVSRIEKSGTGDNNFGKWKGTFRSDRPRWPDRSRWTTFKAGPEYSGRTKPKWSVPFDVPTVITGILGWMESAHGIKVVTQRNSWNSDIFDADSEFWRRKNQTRWYSGTHFLSKNKDFNNGNSLRMREQEDISSCYFTIEETWCR